MKKLLEQKQQLIEECEAILGKAEAETRALTEDEISEYEKVKKDLDNLVKTIELLEKQIETTDKGEQRSMENMEKRELIAEKMLRGEKVTLEARAHDKTSNATEVPTLMHDEVARAMKETSSIVEECKVIVQPYDMEFLTAGAEKEAGFVSETQSVTPTDLNAFSKVKLTNKRCATSILVSKSLLETSPVFALDFIQNEISTRLANSIEKEFFQGQGDGAGNGFTNTFKTAGLPETDISREPAVEPTHLMKFLTGVKEKYKRTGKLYMNRTTFARIAELQDLNGRFYVMANFDHATEKARYSILGTQIVISEYAEDNLIIFADMANLGILKDTGRVELTSLHEKYAENNQVCIIGQKFLDFGITNKEACALLKLPVV